MFKVHITAYFSGAHSLRHYKGKCEALHGHNWKVEVTVYALQLDEKGMVLDFHELRQHTNIVLEKLDHRHLNEIEYFKTKNPSSEEIARYIYQQLKPMISSTQCDLDEVSVWETENSCATYREK